MINNHDLNYIKILININDKNHINIYEKIIFKIILKIMISIHDQNHIKNHTTKS